MPQIFRKLAETATFSPCHNINDKIIGRFVHIQLRIHAKKMKYVVKEQVSEKEALDSCLMAIGQRTEDLHG